MKKIVLLTAALVMSASMAFASGSSIISGTKHNLSTTSLYDKSSAQTQICLFCHTPHNAIRNVPLWNRNNPAGSGFALYTSSATLAAAVKNSSLSADSISLFCLSCHDGGAIEGRIVKYDSTGGTVSGTGTAADKITSSAAIAAGGNLTNSHPIGFDYNAAQVAGTTGLKTLATIQANTGPTGIKFYKQPAKGGVNQLECASCHKVHDNTNIPFLRTTRSGSVICLACHIK